MKLFFSSDPHYFHPKIIKYEDRPFNNVEEMNEIMINNHNKKVGKNDYIYYVGDFSFGTPEQTCKLLDRLNGKKYMVLGNHDKVIKVNQEVRSKFEWVKDYYRLKYNGLKIVLFHYPISVWDCKHHGSVHLFGHVHSNKGNHHPLDSVQDNSYNVGVDVNNFEPVSLEEILEKINYRII